MAETKVKSAWDHNDDSPHLNLQHLLRPSLISMTICGCHRYETDKHRTRASERKQQAYRVFETGYRIFFLLVCLAACGKAGAAFASLPSTYIYLNGIVLAWYMQNLFVFLISLKSNHDQFGGQIKAFDFWDSKIKRELTELGIVFPEEKLKKRQRQLLIFACVVVIFNICGTSLLITDTVGHEFGKFFCAPFPQIPAVQVISCCSLAVLTLIWIFPLTYIAIMATLLTETFKALNEFLENLITRKCFGAMTCQFRRIRLLHLNLSKMVSELDRDFSYYFATFFVFGVCLVCFILYQIIRNPMSTWNVVMFVFWLLSNLSLMGMISVFAAFLNEEVSWSFRFKRLISDHPHDQLEISFSF